MRPEKQEWVFPEGSRILEIESNEIAAKNKTEARTRRNDWDSMSRAVRLLFFIAGKVGTVKAVIMGSRRA